MADRQRKSSVKFTARRRRANELLLPALLLLSLVPFLGARAPLNEIVTAIEFRNLRLLDEQQLLSNLHTQVGQLYDSEKIRRDMEALGRLMRQVEVRRQDYQGGVKVIFTVRENQAIKDLQVFGNTKIKTDRILSLETVKAGGVFPADGRRLLREWVLKLYLDAGFDKVEVEIELTDNDDDSLTLILRIDEGERIRITDLRIEGNQAAPDWKLKLLLESKGSWLLRRNYFSEEDFAKDLQLIDGYYRQLGYFEAEVRRGEFTVDREKSVVSPLIVIEEGPRYRLGAVTIAESALFPEEKLLEPFQDLLGEWIQGLALQEALQRVLRLYQNEGYLQARIEVNYEQDRQTKQIALALIIIERERVYVNRLLRQERPPPPPMEQPNLFSIIHHLLSPPLRNEVLYREVMRAWPELEQLADGQSPIYRKNKELKVERRLRRLGIFNNVSAWNEPSGEENYHDLMIDVEEGLTGNLRLGAGASDTLGIFTYGAYSERNLFGQAKSLRLRGLIGSRAQQFSISYLDRAWRETDTRLSVDIYKELFWRRGYNEDIWGTLLEFGRPLDDDLWRYLGFRAGRVTIDERYDFADDDEALLDGYSFTTGKLEFVRDLRDSSLWPTEGSLSSMALELGFAGGPLAKLTGRYSRYDRLNEYLIYALNLELGLLACDAEEVGIGERFFMGGTNDLRAFDYRGAGPMITEPTDVPTGGATRLLIQNELRFPIYQQLKGLLFVDAGILNANAFDFSSPRLSAGLGFRLPTRNFDLAIYFAAPLLDQSDDRTRTFSFTVGASF